MNGGAGEGAATKCSSETWPPDSRLLKIRRRLSAEGHQNELAKEVVKSPINGAVVFKAFIEGSESGDWHDDFSFFSIFWREKTWTSLKAFFASGVKEWLDQGQWRPLAGSSVSER
jgi:hypothetical protein